MWKADRDEPLSGVSPKSFWLTLDSLKKVLTNAGFDSIRVLRDDPKHCHGPAVTIAAMMQSAVAGDHERNLAFG